MRDYMSKFSTPYGNQYLAKKLKDHFGETIKIASLCGKPDVIYESQSAEKLLNDLFKCDRKEGGDIKQHVLALAGHYIKEEIHQTSYDTHNFLSIDELNLESQLSVLPSSLREFLNTFISKRSKKVDSLSVATIGQCIMHLTMNHYTPPLQVALGTEIHTKTGSQFLIDLFHNHGLVASSEIVRQLERNAAVTDLNFDPANSLIRSPLYAADNVDVKKVTIDGKGTFHGMGAIYSFIPHGNNDYGKVMIKKSKISKEDLLRKSLSIDRYPRSADMNTIQNLKVSVTWSANMPKPSQIDYLRVCGALKDPTVRNISGVMRIVTKNNLPAEKSAVTYLPIIDLKSTDMSCIYTVLNFVIDQHKKFNREGKTIIAFDQPLWQKAMIVKHNSKLDIMIMLGNFHVQLSTMSAIGYLMKATGIEAAFNTVYGEKSIKYIMNGKDYERAVRCHELASTALKLLLLEQIPEDKQYAVEAAKDYFSALMRNEAKTPFLIPESCPVVQNLLQIVTETKEMLSLSPTNKLFFMYLDLYDAFLNNLHAERLGLWDDYVVSLQNLLPFLAAAGRRNYFKCITWYLNDLQSIDHDTEAGLQAGHFVVHRSTDPYSGVSPDLCIEQTLMASIKGNSGLTRGRGFTQLNHVIWTLSRPLLCMLDTKMRKMAGMDHATGQSHVKAARPVRIARDTEDMNKMKTFFEERFIFNPLFLSCKMKSISSGLVAPDSVNVQDAFDIGCKMIKDIDGKNPLNYKVSKTSLAVQMPKTAIVSSAQKEVPDPNLLFQRALALSSSTDSVEFQEFLKFELSPVPMSLFTEEGFLRANNKADLSNHLTKGYQVPGADVDKKKWDIVIDGGGLIHNVTWNADSRIVDILSQYVTYIDVNYRPYCTSLTVVFDGYSQSTKDHCHRKRTPIQGLVYHSLNNETVINKKTHFLSNPVNKQKFIDRLSEKLMTEGIQVIQHHSDADLTIVLTTADKAKNKDTMLIGDDTDLLVLLIHYLKGVQCHDLLWYKPSSKTFIDINALKRQLPKQLEENILAVHAASGCDTVSSLYGVGKTKLCKQLQKTPASVGNLLEQFYSPSISKDDVLNAGIKLILAVYGSKHDDLESHRQM